ncbi:MAG: hypothetical protein H6706_13860, partial [Myxococcales bacterium]|nr:hypothetical protein [Myxococcales bacterium]
GGGPGGFGGGGGGNLDCAGLNECLSGCGEGDDACTDACFGDATPQAQATFTAAIECIQANGGDQNACQAEIEACIGEFDPGPTGDLSCSELNDCLFNCADGDQACGQACFGMATAQAQQQFIAAVECIDANGGNQEACAAEIEACLGGGGPGPGGDLTCGGIFECAGNCPQNDQNCIQGCLAAGTPQAQDLALQLSQCAQNADMNGQDVETACADLINACFQ